MHPTLKALRLLVVPMALTLCAGPALARKHKSKHVEEAPSAAPEKSPPAAAAASPAPEKSPSAATAAPTPSPAAEPSSPATPVMAETSPVPAAPTPATPATPAPGPAKDGVRFRGGISVGGGGEFISGFGIGLGGIDGRLGVQINNLIGVYLQPHVAFGGGTIGGFSGATGTAAASVLVDFTLFNRFFVGAGAGAGILNSPAGAMVQLRLGGYPVVKIFQERARRKALMTGLDTRIYFLNSGASLLPVLQLMATVGYEAF